MNFFLRRSTWKEISKECSLAQIGITRQQGNEDEQSSIAGKLLCRGQTDLPGGSSATNSCDLAPGLSTTYRTERLLARYAESAV